MNVKRVITLVLIMLLSFSHIIYSANGNIQISMNGEKVTVRQVPIIMDGQVIASEFPSFVYGDRTLVPIRFVAENYGAEVKWDDKTKTARVINGDKEAKFTICLLYTSEAETVRTY